MVDVGAMWTYLHNTIFNEKVLFKVLEVSATIVLGYMALKFAMRFVSRALGHHSTAHIRKMLIHVMYYSGVLIIFFSVLHQLNFQITAILGAAGIFTAAIGFASQTSVSNIISGLFLLSEGPYQIGDYIEVEGVAGYIDSIDLLSVKLRKANGTYVRVPHASIITNYVVNTSYYQERRFDFYILVSHKESVQKVIGMMREVIADNKYSLKSPEYQTLISCEEYNDSSLKILVGVWTNQANWQALKDSIIIDIQERFKKDDIVLPLNMYVSFEELQKY